MATVCKMAGEVSGGRSLDDMAREMRYPRRLAAGILAAAAAIGLALACLGLYGIVAYSAAQRTREFTRLTRLAHRSRTGDSRGLDFGLLVRHFSTGVYRMLSNAA
jgi:hypothetical protein